MHTRQNHLSKAIVIEFIGPDKSGYQVNILQGASNEYSQHMFSWRNKKNINTFGLKKTSYQELCEFTQCTSYGELEKIIPI